MKKVSNLKKLLTILKDGKWHTSDELIRGVSWRFGHTIFEARKKGYCIETKSIAHNLYEYCLKAAHSSPDN